jgi:hypothetical protein
MNLHMQEKNFSNKGNLKVDLFNAFMVEKAEYDGYYEIPYIPFIQNNFKILNLVPYDKTSNYHFNDGDIVHFYLDDVKFDGTYGIWNNITYDNTKSKRGFQISRLLNATAVIAPDFSTYYDMPRIMQIWNIYRSRAFGYYLTTFGIKVIPNVRWTDKKSYKYAFCGIHTGSIVSVGTLGCSKSRKDKQFLINGFIELIIRIKPSLIIIYGPIISELSYIIKKYNANIIQFDSAISIAHGDN